MSFADDLQEWTDGDVAAHLLGAHLGVLQGTFQSNKGKFWTNHPVGSGLRAALLALVDAGVLEHRFEPDDQFRLVGQQPQ